MKRLSGLLFLFLIIVFQGAAQSGVSAGEEAGINAEADSPRDSPGGGPEDTTGDMADTPDAAAAGDSPDTGNTAAGEPATTVKSPNIPESQEIKLFPAGGHVGQINALVYDEAGECILSAGADGFLGIWNIRNSRAEERFQLSSYSLLSMALRPGKTQIALIESDLMGSYRISAWDYVAKKKLFILRFRDPLSYITYSGGGNFLIVSRNARTGVVFLDPETGELLRSPEDLSGLISFAATGRSERTMISYSSTGILSYWELDTGIEIRHFFVPPGIDSPVLFGNNRFFAGIDHDGLVILDAVSGNEIIRDTRITRGLLCPADSGAAEFIHINPGNNASVLSRYGITNTGKLEVRERRNLTGNIPSISCAVTAGNVSVLGTTAGSVLSLGRNGSTRVLSTAKRIRVREAGASGGILAFINENSTAGFIPLDFTAIAGNDTIALERCENFTHIEEAPDDPEAAGGSGATFLFWQSDTTRSAPVLRQIPDTGGGSYAAGTGNAARTMSGIRQVLTGSIRLTLDKLPMQFPLRSVSMLDGNILFLDSVGTIRVLSTKTGDEIFSFFAAGSLDAAFLDRGNIVIGRSAVSGNTPFLKVSIETGETVPLSYPASIGARIYRGTSGTLYGAAIDGSSNTAKTSILRIDPLQPAASLRLIEYQGEDTGFGIVECGGALASTIGGDGASLYSPRGFIPFERSPGLPVRLINGGSCFITIDADGNISWHENQTGKLRALLRLYENTWLLEQYNQTGSTIKTGRLTGTRQGNR
ncbi:MAG: WD40 repeat domain-containing protein [Spirochaetaceae bacterium]|jgi:WD40 repeat protein|nr:WD40 repeat domain-containing protein [Spirochaetaceae bacterium]